MEDNQLVDASVLQDAMLQTELISLCEDYAKTAADIDAELSGLPVDTAALNEAASEMEDLISLEASAQALEEKLEPKQRFSVAGETRLRWLLDGEGSPVFEKLDVEVAARYRRTLLQHYHPDKPGTGDPEKFRLVNLAVDTANVEMLALMILSIGHKLDTEALKRYHGASYRRLAKLKAGLSFKTLCLCRTGNKPSATLMVQAEIDKRAALMRVAILTKSKK